MLGLIRISISKGAVLKTDLAKDLPAVLGNRPQIQQVVMNVVLNASDALGDRAGGNMRTVSTSVRPRVQVSVLSPRHQLRANQTMSGWRSPIPVPA